MPPSWTAGWALMACALPPSHLPCPPSPPTHLNRGPQHTHSAPRGVALCVCSRSLRRQVCAGRAVRDPVRGGAGRRALRQPRQRRRGRAAVRGGPHAPRRPHAQAEAQVHDARADAALDGHQARAQRGRRAQGEEGAPHGRRRWLEVASVPSEHTAPPASLGHRKARAAPTHPGAPPEPLGRSPRPQEPASGRPRVEEGFFSTRRRSSARASRRWSTGFRRSSRLEIMASTQSDGTAPSASLDYRKAQAAPTHPGAPPEHLGGLPWPQEPA